MRSWIKRKSQSGPRHIVLHYHIFKNAGSTIYAILERHFGKRLASLQSGSYNSMLQNEDLISFLDKHRKIQAVSSHHLCPPKPQHPDFVFHDVVFLRNPLARLSSTYDFYRRSKVTDDPFTVVTKRKNIAQFMDLLIEQYPGHVNNAQVNFLSSVGQIRGEPTLETAWEVASRATVLGVAEFFDISAILAEQALSPFFGTVNFGYVARNVSSVAPRELSVHLRQFREACGEKTYEKLLQSNSLDLALLELATAEVRRRFEAIPDHEERLRHFMAWRSINMAFGLDPSAIRGALASNHPDDFVRYANAGIE